MKLRSLALNQFKKFTVPTRLKGIEDGLNVVVGPNEMGKSTLLDALRAVLFEKHSSKARPIKALQNDRNQAAPVVELVFELDDGLYRITKRFLKRPYSRLSCPDGRSLEGDAAEDTLRSLLDFHEPGNTGAKPDSIGMWNVLWVQQGQSFDAPFLPESARSSLHSALESEVGAVLGGRRGRALPAVIEKQLGEMITKRAKRPRGQYKDLINRVETGARELEDLRARRKGLKQTLNDLEEAQQNLIRLSTSDRDRADQEDLDDARQRHTQLAELEARIEAAAIELKLREVKVEQAEQAVKDRKQLKAKIKAKEATLEGIGKLLAEKQAQEKEGRSEVNGLRATARQSEAAVNEAEETASRSRRVVLAVERQAKLHDLEERSEKAQAADRRQRKAKQAAASILVTDQAIVLIRLAAKELRTVQDRLETAATHIYFEMTSDSLSEIDVDGEPLPADRTSIRTVKPVAITLQDRGRITVEPGTGNQDELLREKREAATTLKEALAGGGAKSVADAEDQYAKRQELLRDANLARREAELYAPNTDDYEAGAQALADYIEGLRQALEREMNELGLQELPSRQEAEKLLRTEQEHANTVRSALDTARADLSGPEETLGRLQREIGPLEGRYYERQDQLNKLKAQVAEAEKDRSDKELKTAIEKAHDAFSEHEAAIRGLKAQRTDETLPQLKARIFRLERALDERRDKRAKLKEEIAALKSRLEAAEGDGLDEAIAQKVRDLELVEEEKRRQDREVKVLSLLLATLRGAEQEAKEKYLSPVLKRIRPYLQLLFHGAAIRIDENLHITGVVREDGYEEPFHNLSMGTQEQIAVLVRLAFAEMLVEQGRPATVVLDDALVFSDDRRMGRIFDILNMAAQNVQVIVFTCREQLFESLGGRPLSLELVNGEELTSA